MGLRRSERARTILVVDIGGSHVKLLMPGVEAPRVFDSSMDLQPETLVTRVKAITGDWRYEAVSIGYPGTATGNQPAGEAGNLGDGWVAYDFAAAFGRPVRVVNDAVMQALGAHAGGRMLFLGLGTGLGSALVAEHVVVPLELGCLRFAEGETLASRLGKKGLARAGSEAWNVGVAEVVWMLKASFVADEVVLGGGNASLVDPLPTGARRGGNRDALTGGLRLWDAGSPPGGGAPAGPWRILR